MISISIMPHKLFQRGDLFWIIATKYFTSYCAVCFFILLMTSLAACQPTARDLSSSSPYNRAVGKRFVLQKDLYVIKFLDGSGFMLGLAKSFPAGSGVPDDVNLNYIGFKKHNIEIVGVAQRGDVIEIERVTQTGNSYFLAVDYYITLILGRNNLKESVSTFPLLNLDNNPPKATTLATPPIFKADMALPLESDGEWWK